MYNIYIMYGDQKHQLYHNDVMSAFMVNLNKHQRHTISVMSALIAIPQTPQTMLKLVHWTFTTDITMTKCILSKSDTTVRLVTFSRQGKATVFLQRNSQNIYTHHACIPSSLLPTCQPALKLLVSVTTGSSEITTLAM